MRCVAGAMVMVTLRIIADAARGCSVAMTLPPRVRLADDEVAVARGRIADQQKRQLAATRVVERRDGHLLVAGEVEPRAAAVEDEELLLRLAIAPAHHRQRSEDDVPLSTWLFLNPFGVKRCVNCASVPASAAAARSSSAAPAAEVTRMSERTRM